MNCKVAQQNFDERLDGRLAQADEAAFDAHVAGCSVCASAWREYAGAWATVVRHVAAEPSVGFAERALRRLDETLAAPQPSEHPMQWLTPLWCWSLATALIVMLGGTGWLGWQHTRRERAIDPQAEVYVVASQDRLEDFDVVASLDLLNGENRHETRSIH